MKKKLSIRVACIQNNASLNVSANLSKLEPLIQKAVNVLSDIIALPETFCWRGADKDLAAFTKTEAPKVIKSFQEKAQKFGTHFLLGSVAEKSPHKSKFYNTSYLIAPTGKIIKKYRKIHLFDIHVRGRLSLQESKKILAGKTITTGEVLGVPIGFSICYDLRFPELYRKLAEKGSRIVFVPANFTEMTGKVHWEALLRARAIENQIYIVAPAQTGVHPATGVRSYGNSLIIDPWGEVLKKGHFSRSEVLVADLDLKYQAKLRQSFPVLKHRKLK